MVKYIQNILSFNTEKVVVSRDKMVNFIASSMLMKENLSSLLYQGLLWSKTKVRVNTRVRGKTMQPGGEEREGSLW